MKTVDNPQYSEYDTENMQATMTLKRNKKEEILEKEQAQHDQHSKMDYMNTTDNPQYYEYETEYSTGKKEKRKEDCKREKSYEKCSKSQQKEKRSKSVSCRAPSTTHGR